MQSYLKSGWFWAVVVLVVLVLSSVGYYNSFVTLNNGIDGQWAQVENQFQRRLNLIPNLVESVKGIMKQEQTVFTAIAEARTRYGGAQTTDEKVAAAQGIETAVGRLLVVLENYPQLRSSESVARLMDELSGTENRIAVERGRFNEVTREYNTSVETFPARIFASLYGFKARPLFQAEEGAEKAPQVKL